LHSSIFETVDINFFKINKYPKRAYYIVKGAMFRQSGRKMVKCAKVLNMTNCPYCFSSSKQYKHGKTSRGSVRYRCSDCGVTYSNEQKGKLENRQQALVLFSKIKNINAVCEQLKISRRNLIGWLHEEMGADIVQSLSISKDIGLLSRETGIPVRTIRIWYKQAHGDLFGFIGKSAVPNDEIICPHCKTQGNQQKRGFTKTGLQRYFCNTCHHKHTPTSRRPKYSDRIKQSAVERYKRENIISKVAKSFGISNSTLVRWVRDALEAENDAQYQDLPLFQKANRMDSRNRNKK
jgi:transposase-like protein